MIRIQDFVPPIVQKIRHRLKRQRTPVILRNETFPDYATAQGLCSGGWDSGALAEFIVADARMLQQKPVVTPVELRAMNAAGWALAESKLRDANALNVIDFGGSAGFNYFASAAAFRSVLFHWAVVETPAMAERAGLDIAGPYLTFHTALHEAAVAIAEPHLVFSCGASQYHPQPLTALGELIQLNAPAIVLFRTALNDSSNTVWAIQEAMLSQHLHSPIPETQDILIRYPVTFVPRSAVRDILTASYEIVAEIDEGVLNPLPTPMHGYAFFCRRRG